MTLQQFLHKFKAVAYRADLNCGHCVNKAGPRCADSPVREHFYLHRLRKTAATRWHQAGIKVRTIQAWLGHKSLGVTQRYLAVEEMQAPHVRKMIEAAAFD
jgi:integrase